MQRIHNEQIREQKMRQYIHENSVELRELEKKLNYAYTNKERALQLKEKSLSQEAEKLEQQTVIEAMKIQQVKLEQLELEKQRKNMERAAQYNDALNNQLQELEDRKKQEYETFLKEKALVDEVVQKIIEEDERSID
ncbi:tumor suppressor, Mitostatin-domain-containing protein [Gorgonomyces haynaldii]|nr:tumor suppressor, Mitostatin-domain-containing protein [Gorgonomyces haynaldii]